MIEGDSQKCSQKISQQSKKKLLQILRIDGYIQDIYMAVYADKILLLDGCCRPDVDLVLDTIRHILGRDISELKVVIVTHLHADHAGGASYLRERTGCKIISSNKPSQWYGGFDGRMNYLLDLGLSYFVAYRQGNRLQNMNYPIDLHSDIVVNEGDPVPMFEDWQILETAGHTDRDLSVYHQATGKIYVADLIIRLKSRRRGERFMPPYNLHDTQEYKVSINKVKVLEPTMIMMAHGGQAFIDGKILNNNIFDELIAMTPSEPRTNRDIYNDVVFGFFTNRKANRKANNKANNKLNKKTNKKPKKMES